MSDISEIKLIRTDTTLDLSQKAEKVKRSQRCKHQVVGPAAREESGQYGDHSASTVKMCFITPASSGRFLLQG